MEPVSTSGLAAFLKFYGAAIMVTLAIALVATVVIMMRLPRSPQEWAVGLICTVVSRSYWRCFYYREMGFA